MVPDDGSNVVVIGGGIMGAGIAHALLEAPCALQVHVVEAGTDRMREAAGRIEAALARARRDTVAEIAVAEAMGRLHVHGGVDDVGTASLVVEAVPEDPHLKGGVLARASESFPDALLATNTSALSITRLADAVDDPGRFLGMHFFNPVARSQLIEIVVGPATSPPAVLAARQWAELLGKQTIEVRDSPGFATSRLGVAVGLEAIRMVEENVATVEDIDRAMVLGYRFPMGPLELTDLVGLDTRLAIAEHLAAELGPRFEPPQLLRDKVAAGETGRKAGRGFYDWRNR